MVSGLGLRCSHLAGRVGALSHQGRPPTIALPLSLSLPHPLPLTPFSSLSPDHPTPISPLTHATHMVCFFWRAPATRPHRGMKSSTSGPFATTVMALGTSYMVARFPSPPSSSPPFSCPLPRLYPSLLCCPDPSPTPSLPLVPFSLSRSRSSPLSSETCLTFAGARVRCLWCIMLFIGIRTLLLMFVVWCIPQVLITVTAFR